MGRFFPNSGLKTSVEVIVMVLIATIIMGVVYYLSPGLQAQGSKILNSINVEDSNIDNKVQAEMLPLPSEKISNKVSSRQQTNIVTYGWNCLSGIIVANGGPKTTEGSLMEKRGVNLNIIRQNMFDQIRASQLKFVKNNFNCTGDDCAALIAIMGDGAPFYIATTQKMLDETYGKGKYTVQVMGAIGMSYGEDKLIGPLSWKKNPKEMIGKTISVVVGDGDWVVLINYCFANKLPINLDTGTYDPNAVNIYNSENWDYIKSAEELIKSQTQGWTVTLELIKDGKRTGEMVKKPIDGCATWTPGDEMVFNALNGFTDIVSTKEFNNQMPTTIIGIKEWADKNQKTVSDILAASYEAGNQMKLYDDWRERASVAVHKTFKERTPKYWYEMFQGQKKTKNGVEFNLGGSRVFNYADAMQYYGLNGDGNNRYKSIYEQVSTYLVELNPNNFNNEVGAIISFEQAFNTSYLRQVDLNVAGATYQVDYTSEKTNVIASGEWHINFATGSSNILNSSNKELETIYNLLVQAEDSKITIIGHTDNTGNYDLNKSLSEQRANSVVDYLTSRGINHSRIQLTSGKGSDEPIASNLTADGRAKNRRVQITLLN